MDYCEINELFIKVANKKGSFEVLLSKIMPYFESVAYGSPDPADVISRCSVALYKLLKIYDPNRGTPMTAISMIARSRKVDSWRHYKPQRIIIDSELVNTSQGTDANKFCGTRVYDDEKFFDDEVNELEEAVSEIIDNNEYLNDNQKNSLHNGNLNPIVEHKLESLRNEFMDNKTIQEWRE